MSKTQRIMNLCDTVRALQERVVMLEAQLALAQQGRGVEPTTAAALDWRLTAEMACVG